MPFALVRDDDVVVVAERAVALQGSSREILDLCDGANDVDAIVAEMQRRHPRATTLREDVTGFVESMSRHGVLRLDGAPDTGADA